MNQQVVEEAYFILHRKVQVAVAFYIARNCSQKENIQDYARDLQNKYRMKSNKCNIPLEREIFLQQMNILLPKFHDPQAKQEVLPTPMEIDVEGEIDPTYVDFSSKLAMVTEFLDALYVLLLILRQKSVSSEDIFRIFSKFSDLDSNFQSYKNFGMIEISMNAMKQCLRPVNFKRTAKECVIEIVRLFKIYFNDLPQQQSLSSEESLVWMKKANVIMMKCIDDFALEGHYQDVIVNLVHESIELTFMHQPKNVHFEVFRYHIVRKWRYHKLLCINAINIFIRSLEDIKKKMDSSDKKKYLIILKFINLFLKTYCEIHRTNDSLALPFESTTDILYEFSSNRRKRYIIPRDTKLLKIWARSLIRLIDSKCRISAITKLASSCFFMISSTLELEYSKKKLHH